MAEITPVAVIHTPYTSKFGIPRQSGLVDAECSLTFTKEFRTPEILRGIEGYSHLWLIWGFSEASYTGGATVRPPRLGGNKRMGIFATRSPFRPNSLGLSCVELVRVEYHTKDGPVLFVKGADMLDGTPIYDIKPYLPFTDSIPDARGGFSDDVRDNAVQVVFLSGLNEMEEGKKEQLRILLENDPRPHYQNDPAREYAFEYAGYRIRFTCENNVIYVKEVAAL